MDNEKEKRMIAAHQAGLAEAAEGFAVLSSLALTKFKDNEERYSFMAGYIQQLKRITNHMEGNPRRDHLAWGDEDVEHLD